MSKKRKKKGKSCRILPSGNVIQLNFHGLELVFNLQTIKSMNNQRIVVSVNLKRTIKIMKLTMLMLIVCLSQVVAATYAQTAKLNVSAENETLENVLKQIEKQSEFLFFYNLEEINKNEKISIVKQNANIQDVLDAIVAKTGLKYVIKDRHVVLTTKSSSPVGAVTQQGRKLQVW